jgi:hypothetical protein
LKDNADLVRQIRGDNGDPIPDIRGLVVKPQAQAKAAISISNSTGRQSTDQYLNRACTSRHVVSDRELLPPILLGG